jgi:hypothetical protein
MVAGLDGLANEFDLAAERERKPRRVEMETEYVHYAMTGARQGAETYAITLQFDPIGGDIDRYVCTHLDVSKEGGNSFPIPELQEWGYTFDMRLNGDARGPMFGIPQDRFARLTDGAGSALDFETRYAAYDTFIDFHSVNDTFTRPLPVGKGIQDLKRIGDRAIHPASFIQAQMSFGSEVKPGSTFRNGEVSLELKALSVVDNAPCAVVKYDAGESKLRMILSMADGTDAVAEGGSLYGGEIYIDLVTRSVRKATLDEYMVLETEVKGAPARVQAFTVRHIKIRQAPTT